MYLRQLITELFLGRRLFRKKLNKCIDNQICVYIKDGKEIYEVKKVLYFRDGIKYFHPTVVLVKGDI